MSADNCVALLKTPHSSDQGFEYRVAHISGIDNYRTDDNGDYTDDPQIQINNAREMWKNSEVYNDEATALRNAIKMHNEVGWTEYGILWVEILVEF